MRVGILSETHPPRINGVTLTVVALALRLIDAPHGGHTSRPRTHSDGRVAGSGDAMQTLPERSAT